MSYNTRRSGTGGNFGANPANPIGNIGQRRPQAQSLSSNFVPGGQLSQGNNPQQQFQAQKPPQQLASQQQQQQQQKQPQQQQKQQQFRQQTPSQPQPQAQAQPPTPQLKQQPAVRVQTAQPTAAPPQQPPQTIKDEATNIAESTNGDETMTGSPVKKRPFWMRRPPGKISKKERLRRRNMRLRKILQPKNALMVLNELAGNVVYNITEISTGLEPIISASVVVDGIEHVGIGKSKVAAKQSAAETAIKHLVLSRLRTDAANAKTVKTEEANKGAGGDENDASAPAPMETNDDTNAMNPNETDVSWSHVASYALHKLLSAWDDGDNLTERIAQATANVLPTGARPFAMSAGSDGIWKPMSGPVEKKPAKKLPENAALMNPVMLLNQMRPNAVYEEVSKTGTPPNVMFTIKCTTDNEAFFGTGSSKKAARKQCAFEACRKVLNIEYPKEIIESEGLNSAPAPVGMQIG